MKIILKIMKKKIKTVQCPQCGKKLNYGVCEFRPFCSERCQLIDLGHWLEPPSDESPPKYHIPGESDSSGEEGS